jgi:hypothetical protein
LSMIGAGAGEIAVFRARLGAGRENAGIEPAADHHDGASLLAKWQNVAWPGLDRTDLTFPRAFILPLPRPFPRLERANKGFDQPSSRSVSRGLCAAHRLHSAAAERTRLIPALDHGHENHSKSRAGIPLPFERLPWSAQIHHCN